MPDPVAFGRYRVEGRIGSGAFASVWLAQDDLLQAPVAVKLLGDNWTDRLDIRRRFTDEARILRRADSDHVVRVHDIGELDGGRPYFVMTYADRGTLADRLAEGPMPVRDAITYACGVAEGLSVLHELGVVHRDIKPSNVLLRSTGDSERVLIADLGLARAIAHASGFTLAAGTPGYMAPEQGWMGGGIDARADVYALGALLLHAATGDMPRPVTDERSAADSAADIERTLPEQLRPVVAKAMSLDPADRYGSAAELAHELRALGGVPVGRPQDAGMPAAPPPITGRQPDTQTRLEAPPMSEPGPPAPDPPPDLAPPLQQPVPDSHRGRWITVGVALVVVAAAVGTGVGVWYGNRGDLTATDSTKTISVRVPRSWDQAHTGPWTPTQFVAGAGSNAALSASPDEARFTDPADATPGVFVGIIPAAADQVPGFLKKVTRPGCQASGLTNYTNVAAASSPPTDRTYSCTHPAVRYDEIFVPLRDGTVAYVQIKSAGDVVSRAKEILGSLKIAQR